MSLNREELMRRYTAHKAAAAACEAALKADALREWVDHKAAVTWRFAGVGNAAAALSHDAVTITDEERFNDWLQARYPDEFVMVRQVRNVAWRGAVLGGLIPLDPDEVKAGESTLCMARQEGGGTDGEVVPGVQWTKGGKYLHTSITPDAGLKRQYADAAQAYVNGAPMPAIDPPPPAVEATASTPARPAPEYQGP